MASNPETDGIVALLPAPNGTNAGPPKAAATEAGPVASQAFDQPDHPTETAVPERVPQAALGPEAAPARARRRRGWILPVGIGAVGLITASSLGVLLSSTTGQRDTARHQLAATRATLATTQQTLSAAQADAATRKVTADYLAFYIADSGRLLTDYQNVAACKSFGECRSGAQQLLSDSQSFQADRAAANVPPALANANAMLGDGLSAGIAAAQELIAGMDDDNIAKLKDGGHKLDAAMLAVGKAESALGAGLK